MNAINKELQLKRLSLKFKVSQIIAAAAGTLFLVTASAQSFPQKPITFIYPYLAGSNAEAFWRFVLPEVSKSLGQPVLIENRAGAGGKIGLQQVMRAANDGYTVGMLNQALGAILPAVDPDFRIEIDKDYTPISSGYEGNQAIGAHPSVQFRDLPGLLKYAKANPGKLNFGSTGNGSGAHLCFELLMKSTGIKLTHIPYKGQAQVITDLLAGQIQLGCSTDFVKQLSDKGPLVGIVTTGAQRWNVLPHLPTLREMGVPVESIVWQGLIGPAGIKRDIVQKLNGAMQAAQQKKDIQGKVESIGLSMRSTSPEEFRTFVVSEFKVLGDIARSANITLQ